MRPVVEIEPSTSDPVSDINLRDRTRTSIEGMAQGPIARHLVRLVLPIDRF